MQRGKRVEGPARGMSRAQEGGEGPGELLVVVVALQEVEGLDGGRQQLQPLVRPQRRQVQFQCPRQLCQEGTRLPAVTPPLPFQRCRNAPCCRPSPLSHLLPIQV